MVVVQCHCWSDKARAQGGHTAGAEDVTRRIAAAARVLEQNEARTDALLAAIHQPLDEAAALNARLGGGGEPAAKRSRWDR